MVMVKGIVIDIIRNANWNYILQSSNMEQEIYDLFSFINTQRSGSTLSIVKIFTDYFEFFWIGDSKIILFKNEKKNIFESLNHNFQNENEVKRVSNICKIEKRCKRRF